MSTDWRYMQSKEEMKPDGLSVNMESQHLMRMTLQDLSLLVLSVAGANGIIRQGRWPKCLSEKEKAMSIVLYIISMLLHLSSIFHCNFKKCHT